MLVCSLAVLVLVWTIFVCDWFTETCNIVRPSVYLGRGMLVMVMCFSCGSIAVVI